MAKNPRFTIELTIRDNYAGDVYRHAIGCDEALRANLRDVEDLKDGPEIGCAFMTLDQTVSVMKKPEIRRDILKQTAVQLAGQMADRMQDAEGWHDASRIGPARKALGGSWRS